MAFFRNSWSIGIITGIISGVLVHFITSRFLDNKKKKEYFSHIEDANKEVVDALKPYIAEQGLPEFDVFNAIILSAARRHAVDHKDLYSPAQFCDEIIGEIIRDVYVSSEKKKEYSEAVTKYKRSIISLQVIEESSEDRKITNNLAKQFDSKKEYITSSITIVCGILGGVFAAVGNTDCFNEVKNFRLFNGVPVGDVFNILGTFIVGVLFFLAMIIFFDVIKSELKERRRRERIGKIKRDSDNK